MLIRSQGADPLAFFVRQAAGGLSPCHIIML